MKKNGATTTPPPPRWLLRVHAEGAQGIKAATGLGAFDTKPDPYVVFVLGSVTKQCEPAQDVEPVKYFSWPKAIVEFEIADEATLLQTSLVVHVKDSDTLKDRYIGGTSIPLAPLYAVKQGEVLCPAKFFPLEYADEKFKNKKSSGEIKLTLSVVDTAKKPEFAPVVAVQVEKAAEVIKEEERKPPPVLVAVEEKKGPAKEEKSAVTPDEGAVVAPLERQPPRKASVTTPGTAMVAAETAAPIQNSVEPIASKQPSQRQLPAAELQPKDQPQEPDKPQAAEPLKEVAAVPSGPAEAARLCVTTLKIELVSARNLTRPTSLGAFLDRKPDPMVTLKFYGLTKSSVAMKDVDLKKPIEWTNTFLAFELPPTKPPSKPRKGCGPMSLVVHVKDENLIKSTYMGGGTLDLTEFFQPRDEGEPLKWSWLPTPNALGTPSLERVVSLTFADEKLTKQKQCGEITLRFHFVTEPLAGGSAVQEKQKEPLTNEQPAIENVVPSAIVEDRPPVVVAAEVEPEGALKIESSTAVAADAAPPSAVASKPTNLSSDIKMLSIELLCGRDLVKPSVKSLAKSVLKSLFDRRPDPYATLVLGSQTKKCAAVNDVDVAFFEWKKSVQVFEFTNKPYPEELFVHIRDEDAAGSDPYMGGARIAMKEIWDEAIIRAASEPRGDPQLVKTYQLMFTDDKMTKQKSCGSITVRFRWIYADLQLPVEIAPVAPLADTTAAPVTARPSVPVLQPRMGFLYLRKMAVYYNQELLDASLDLYVEASCPTIHASNTVPPAVAAISSVLTDAMKGKDKSSKTQWLGDELVVPICVPSDDEEVCELRVDLKDKNAIMKDTDIALKNVKLKDHNVDFVNSQSVLITVELAEATSKKPPAKTSVPRTIKFETEIQFLPHTSPILSASSSQDKHSGGILTLFLLRSVFTPSPLVKDAASSITSGLFTLAIDCLATKKAKGLLSFGKSAEVDFQTPSLPVSATEATLPSISWWSSCDFPFSSKQVATVKEKEALDMEISVRMKSGKSEKPVGSLQLNVHASAFTPTAAVRVETIQFGTLGSMQLEFAAAFRSLADDSTTKTHSAEAAKNAKMPVAPPVPSGDLHLLVMYAKNLVSPDPKQEKAEDLDPEVRVSIEPKYIKRKENPVRSMLKTKPLENAGAVPTWNEYLRLEYRLPPPPPPPPPLPRGAPATLSLSFPKSDELAKYPPPIVQLGVFDIQIPGERNGSQPIGKVELPLSAFLLQVNGATTSPDPVVMSLDVYLSEKKTGVLSIEGVFEPLAADAKPVAEDPVEVYRQQCRSMGRRLRDKSKKLKSGEMATVTSDLLTNSQPKKGVAGRLEVHVIGFRSGGGPDSVMASEDQGLAAHLWLSSSVEDRREVKSKLKAMSSGDDHGCQVKWDAQLTLFTSDVTAELLRSEVLTLTGKPIGSLKLPLGGLIQQGRGSQPLKDWYTLLDATSTSTASNTKKPSKSKDPVHEVLIELTFFVDQAIFDPLAVVFLSIDVSTSSAVVVVGCQRVIYLEEGADPAGGVEVACKCTLLGHLPLVPTGVKTQAMGVERTAFKICEQPANAANGNSVVRATWEETLTLEIGGSAHGYITRSFANGSQPALRIELLTRRPGARFQSTTAATSISLVSLLQSMNSKACRWLKLYDEGDAAAATKPRLVALIQIDIVVLEVTVANEEKIRRQAVEDAQIHAPLPGVLCLRFLAARNLVDVDANGEQDPYVIAKVVPRSFSSPSSASSSTSPSPATLLSACQTGVSLNGGRHPTWNTSIFELRVEDLRTDYVRLEVLDSNEEDHLSDAYIGAVDVALASLFRDNVIKKTRWLEAWVPIYPVSQLSVDDDDDRAANVGEVRVEFRFLTHESYQSASRQQEVAITGETSPFASSADEAAIESVRGTLCLHIVQATGLQCAKGMQPGVRIAHGAFSYTTKPGKQSITDPQWEEEVVEIPWPGDDGQEVDDGAATTTASQLQVEIVDLAVRTANAHAMAVIVFGSVDIRTFLSHPLAKSYHLYPLHGRKPRAKGEQGPNVLIGCQFVPQGHALGETRGLQQSQSDRTGNLHVKGVSLQFDVAAYLTHMPLGGLLSLRFTSGSPRQDQQQQQTKSFDLPVLTLPALVESCGLIELKGSDASLLFKYCSKDMQPTAGSPLMVTPNPIIVGELLVTTNPTGTANEHDVVAVLARMEVPVFDYVLVDGHLCASSYAVVVDDNPLAKLGEIQLEVQFLPVLNAPSEAISKVNDAAQANVLFDLEIKYLTGVVESDSNKCCVISVEWLGCSVETKPSIPSTASGPPALRWNETLDLPVSVEMLKAPGLMKLELRSASDASVVLGFCHWIVPDEYLRGDEDGSRIPEDVVVPLQFPSTSNINKSAKAKNVPPPELVFRFSRHRSGPQNTNVAAAAAANRSTRPRGVLYVAIGGNTSNSSIGKPLFWKGAVLATSSVKSINLLKVAHGPSSNAWTALSVTERRAIPVENERGGSSSEPQCMAITVASSEKLSLDDCIYLALLDPRALGSVLNNPGVETFHQLAVEAIGKPTDPSPPIARVECKLLYVTVCDGQLELQLTSLSCSTNPGVSKTSTSSFRLETRLLATSSQQRWVNSSIGNWNRKAAAISWQDDQKEILLRYSNADETIEPVVQLVLLEVAENDQPKKIAFGQISVMDSITRGVGGSEDNVAFQQVTTELARIGGGEDAVTALTLCFQLRFVRDAISVEERDAQVAEARAAKSLELAEGTVALKKAFAAMGGDERTAITIAQLKAHVAGDDDEDGAKKQSARDVLQHAADVETNGDLDELFALMDVNGDGQISWNEYVGHLQNIHALADAGATRAMDKQQQEDRGGKSTPTTGEKGHNPQDDHDDDEEDDNGEEDVRDDDHEEDEDEEDGVNVPVRSMPQHSEGASAIQDVYGKPSAIPSGQSTKEPISRGASPAAMQANQRRPSKPELAAKEKEKPEDKTTTSSAKTVKRESSSNQERQSEPHAAQLPAKPKKQLPLLDTYVLDWKVDEVVQWMTHEMELGQYAEAVQRNAVNGKLLLTLQDEELESELGIVGVLHKRKIMNQIREFQERFQYPPVEVPQTAHRAAMTTAQKKKAALPATVATNETPAFIKREQLVYQEKQRVKQEDAAQPSWQPKTLGQTRVFPTKTMIVRTGDTAASVGVTRGPLPTQASVPNTATAFSVATTALGETFDDAMADIFEVVHPDSPEQERSGASGGSAPVPRLAVIQIGSITNTDELFEIVRQRIHQLSELLLPIAAAEYKDTFSDFGDDPDDDDADAPPVEPSQEQTGLRLVFNALNRSSSSSTLSTISRLKFQEGLAGVLSIEVSWHQFDLLFRRLDVDGDSELGWHEFHSVFTKRHISFESDDLVVLQEALVHFVLDRLESQQWTLSDLFKAFDRDGGGAVSIAEFATLVRFLFTSSSIVKRHQQQTKSKITKRHAYMLMSCLDGSADRRISLQEFLRFFFIVWSSKLMQVQDQLLEMQDPSTTSQPAPQNSSRASASAIASEELFHSLKEAKHKLRRALRTNFSRPFRDAMRCLDVSIPGPFTGVLTRLQLLPSTSAATSLDLQEQDNNSASNTGLQVWQVLRGQTNTTGSNHHGNSTGSRTYAQLQASRRAQEIDASRKRMQKDKNEVQRTRLTRQREPNREDAVLQTPNSHVALDGDAKLKFDFRPK